MNPNPLVSIIIPTYNRAHLIMETLDSVLAQTYTNWECIVVDDGSTDGTDKLVDDYVKKDLRFQYYQRPVDRPKGANACRNYGFELSKGEYVNWFDSDDIMHRDKLLIQVRDLENCNHNFSVCQTLVFENSIENVLGFISEKIHSYNLLYDYVTQEITWFTQAPLWRKNFLNSLAYLFDEELQAAQEWEFHCRALFFSKDYIVTNDPLVYIRRHSDSISNNSNSRERMWNYFLARKKIYNNDKIALTEELALFLQEYLLCIFKNFVRLYYLKESVKTFFLFILFEKKIKFEIKFYALISIFSFLVTRRGDVFLKRVKYTR